MLLLVIIVQRPKSQAKVNDVLVVVWPGRARAETDYGKAVVLVDE